jgi:hypothetical protein
MKTQIGQIRGDQIQVETLQQMLRWIKEAKPKVEAIRKKITSLQ